MAKNDNAHSVRLVDSLERHIGYDTAREFEEYELEKDKDGNIITGYPDKNNHHIDAVRYALERVWSRRGE